MSASSSVVFTIRKLDPMLVTPVSPTPQELKLLSGIDDQPSFRFHSHCIQIYRASPVMASIDPAAIIHDSLAKALVFYYPLAGRLRELSDGKLAVECTGKGAVFVEADDDVPLDQLGKDIHPPFPCFDQLIHGIGADYLTSPIISVQVTRYSCGGFILAHQTKHSVFDEAGTGQFLKTMVELAHGASYLSVPPVWEREPLTRDPPRFTHDHPE